MLNTETLPYGPKINNASGSTGQLSASEYNDTQSELNQQVIESGQIFNVTKTPYQLSRSETIKGMNASSWLEDSATATANLSNLIPMNSQTLITFDKAFVSGNIITFTINSTTIGPISYATSNAVTFSAIKSAIQAVFPSATVSINANVYGSFYYISIYQSGATFAISNLSFSGTGVTTPNYQVSYGNTTPDSYAEMDGSIIIFNKSIVNSTSTPQINIATGLTTAPFNTISSMLGVITVTLPGGAAVPIGSMSGLCIVRFNLTLNSGQGYWELLYSDSMVNKVIYPTGSNDDIIIQAAINATSANGGGTVYLGTGTFNIKNHILPKSNVNIKGQGYGTVLQRGSVSLTEVIYISNTIANFSLEDFLVDGNGSNYILSTTCYGIYGQATTNINERLKNITVINNVVSGATGYSCYGIYNCTNLVNCASITNIAGGIGATGYGFYGCINSSNCFASGNSATGIGAGTGFSHCTALSNCISNGNLGVGNGNGHGYHTCTLLNNCQSIGNIGDEGDGFKSCIQVIGCIGSNNTGTIGYGFNGCTRCQQNTGSGNTTNLQTSCYADNNSNGWALTAAGGYNG